MSVLYENQQYHPKFQYLTGVARDDASYLLCKLWFRTAESGFNIFYTLDANKTIAPDYSVGWPFFDIMVKDHINQYNYTLNPIGIFNSIKFMYTYYPDPNNKTHIREEFVRVSLKWPKYFQATRLHLILIIFSSGLTSTSRRLRTPS